jgi:hypothetical protein
MIIRRDKTFNRRLRYFRISAVLRYSRQYICCPVLGFGGNNQQLCIYVVVVVVVVGNGSDGGLPIVWAKIYSPLSLERGICVRNMAVMNGRMCRWHATDHGLGIWYQGLEPYQTRSIAFKPHSGEPSRSRGQGVDLED